MINKNATIYEAFRASANIHLNETALIYEHKKFNYSHVLHKINSLAYSLTNLGYKRDDVISVMLPNIPNSVYLLYAINQIGGIANLLHPLLNENQVKEIMKKTNSKILFLLDSRAKEFKALKVEGISIYAVSPVDEINPIKKIVYKSKTKVDRYEKTLSSLYTDKTLEQYDKSYLKDAFYLHSGGTTGEAKTIALSSFAVNSLASNGLSILDIENGKNMGMLSVLPMFHGFGLVMGIHVSLIFGAFNVLLPKFHTKDVISYLKKNQIQTIIGVPSLYEALLRNRKFSGKILEGLKNAFVGGDFVSESLKFRFNELMKHSNSRARLFEGYGLTETVTVCSVNTNKENKEGTVGKALPNVKISAFGPKYNELIANELGELCVSGETLMNGYRFENNPVNPFFFDKNKTKWVKTGDYGKVDSEGYVYFVQRIKRIIKIKGNNVFPSQIENEVMSLPFIFECYLASQIDSKGTTLKLYVVLDKKYKGQYFNEQINDTIIAKFGIFAIPKEIIYLDRFNKTMVGKIDSKSLK